MSLFAKLLAHPKRNTLDFGPVYDTYFQRIFNFILGRTGQVADAEDLAAQTFFNALKHYHKVPEDRLEPWLYRIANNEVNQFYRGRKAKPFHATVAPNHDLQQLQDRELTQAEQILARQRLFASLNGALRCLKPIDQALLALRFFEGKSYQEIADILGVREGTLATRASRALARLKDELAKRGIDHERVRESIREQQAGYSGPELSAQSAP